MNEDSIKNCCLKKYNNNKKHGFTLAEVLITLGIIGVVAALTLPALIQNYQKKVVVNRLKKSYSVLSNAISMINAELSGAGLSNSSFVVSKYDHPNCFDPILFESAFSEVIKHSSVERCQGTVMCLAENSKIKYYRKNRYGTYELENYNEYKPWFKWELNDGTTLYLIYIDKNWTWINDDGTAQSHVYFVVDINSERSGFNMLGKDTFFFEMLPNGNLVGITDGAPCTMEDYNKSLNITCANKIIEDGWEMKDDYPWY